MAGWHHWLDGHESGWTPVVGDGQGGMVCCDSWGHKELDMTEQLIWSDLICKYQFLCNDHFTPDSVTSDGVFTIWNNLQFQQYFLCLKAIRRKSLEKKKKPSQKNLLHQMSQISIQLRCPSWICRITCISCLGKATRSKTRKCAK